MRIAVVSTTSYPPRETNWRDAEAASLARAFVTLGHQVRAVALLSPGADVGALSLARRLSPVEIDVKGRKVSSHRFDGRTSSGVEIHLLEADRFGFHAKEGFVGDAREIEAFSRAAIQILGSFKTKTDCCISWNADASLVPAFDADGSADPVATRHVLSISTLEGDMEALKKGIAAAHKVAIFRSAAVGQKANRSATLAALIADRRAVTISRPVESKLDVGKKSRSSAKAARQICLKLPVRHDVPLVFFAEPSLGPFAEALPVFLKGQVQAIAPSGHNDLEALAERYPDRLALIRAADVSDDLLSSVDGCAIGSDPDLVVRAMACGAVPVAGPGCNSDLVDLEPSLESGSGIAIGSWSAKGAIEGLSRLVAAFESGPAFDALSARLPRNANTWRETAELYAQLIEEADR